MKNFVLAFFASMLLTLTSFGGPPSIMKDHGIIYIKKPKNRPFVLPVTAAGDTALAMTGPDGSFVNGDFGWTLGQLKDDII